MKTKTQFQIVRETTAPCGQKRYGSGGVFAKCPRGCVTECQEERDQQTATTRDP